jgi:hypothetical protein
LPAGSGVPLQEIKNISAMNKPGLKNFMVNIKN